MREIFFNQGSDAEASERPAALVDKESFGDSRLWFAPVVAFIRRQQFNCRRPERREARFVSFAGDRHQAVLKVEPRQFGVGDFLSAGAGIIKEGENTQIPEPVGCRGKRLR